MGEGTVGHRSRAGQGWAGLCVGTGGSTQFSVFIASGRKNAPLSHQVANYRRPLLSSTGRTSKTEHRDGGERERERERGKTKQLSEEAANNAIKIEGWELRHRQGVNI